MTTVRESPPPASTLRSITARMDAGIATRPLPSTAVIANPLKASRPPTRTLFGRAQTGSFRKARLHALFGHDSHEWDRPACIKRHTSRLDGKQRDFTGNHG